MSGNNSRKSSKNSAGVPSPKKLSLEQQQQGYNVDTRERGPSDTPQYMNGDPKEWMPSELTAGPNDEQMKQGDGQIIDPATLGQMIGMQEEEECDCDPSCVCPEELGEYDEEEEDDRDMLAQVRTEGPAPNYNLNDFVRAKEFFMTHSAVTGISLYDHFSELIRKLLDNGAPKNPVDFIEEISLNLKRYRFGKGGTELIQDAFCMSEPLMNDSRYLLDNWTKHAMWSVNQEAADRSGDGSGSMGGFPNLLRLQYYLQQINIGLPQEEIFRVALAVRQVKVTRPVARIRLWGKIFGTDKSYYVAEVELSEENEQDLWNAPPDSPLPGDMLGYNEEEEYSSSHVPGAKDTFERAGNVVLDNATLSAYQSGLPAQTPPNSAGPNDKVDELLGERPMELEDTEQAKEGDRWKEYQQELLRGLPEPHFEQKVEVPPEEAGKGVNRRIFYVCNDLTEDWVRLPFVTPQQINISRSIRWFLTGKLDAKVRSVPPFPGREGHYLRALLARITAGCYVSPRGYYRTTTKYGDEEEGEDEEEEDVEEDEEDEDGPKGDVVYPKKKFRVPVIGDLANPTFDLWVHHASCILKQGRTQWFNLEKLKKKSGTSEDEEDVDEEEEDEDEEGSGKNKNKEIAPALFRALAEDRNTDWEGWNPWSARTSSSVFQEFQVVNVRSNMWPGANAMCTFKGKVENIYLGDGLKFRGHSYAPPIPDKPQQEYKDGPELTEITDPTADEEQAWLAKLQLQEIADVEEKFVDNEDEGEEEEEEDEEEDD